MSRARFDALWDGKGRNLHPFMNLRVVYNEHPFDQYGPNTVWNVYNIQHKIHENSYLL